jgi:hypothetical protein
MLLNRILVLVVLGTGAMSAQTRAVTVADFAGTWNIEMMSHQIALVIEPQDGNKVTATMMVMGRDVPLKGELVDKTLTLVGVKTEGDAAPSNHGGGVVASNNANAKPLVMSLQDDGTLAGEMMTNQGPVKWTGEKLKTRKKPTP